MTAPYVDERYEKHLLLLHEFDKILSSPTWDNSIFLGSYKNKLQGLRDYFQDVLNLHDGYLTQFTIKSAKVDDTKHIGQIKVYISIYNADGDDLDKWVRLIINLVNKVITRPVYRVEDDVSSLIRNKDKPKNEGYLVVYVNNSDLLTPPDNNAPLDKLGHELLLLKDNSIRLNNIIKFVHADHAYELKYNKLILMQ